MNRNKLKTYAPKARRAFIQAVAARASKFGITASYIEPIHVQGDVTLIGGQAFPHKVAEQRRRLEERIALRGFERVMEEAAYTWFNRLAAIRFMEVHGYLDHGYRVLSHPEGKATPEIIEQAEHIDLPGLERAKIIDLMLDGTKEEELYRMLLTAQCNALHAAMPFLFERIDDETELLLPDNLLHSNSIIRQMADQIDESDWQEIEIIGWLYQFYISEKKDQVIGTAVKSEDIPAVTQLFTPKWIVKYMVQNSLGAKWLATYPESGIRTEMEYYIDPPEQLDEVKAKLLKITPKELNPEDLTFIDPACGSGHILVEAYELFKAIYLDRGYMLREIPKLVLEKNVFGLDIDDRAAQLASFALLMKARADDRRILEKSPHLNIMAIQSSEGLNAGDIVQAFALEHTFELVPSNDLFPTTLNQPILTAKAKTEVSEGAIKGLLSVFEGAKTYGSLITIPEEVQKTLTTIKAAISCQPQEQTLQSALQKRTFKNIAVFLKQAALLSRSYDAVVANPPYMGRKGMNNKLKAYAASSFPKSQPDLFSMFIERNMKLAKRTSFVSMVTMDSWLHGDDYTAFREIMIKECSVNSLVHLGPRAFDEISGEVVQVAAFALSPKGSPSYRGSFFRLIKPKDSSGKETMLRNRDNQYSVEIDGFRAFPKNIFAYYADTKTQNAFRNSRPLSSIAEAFTGLQTGDNPRFIRSWFEVQYDRIAFHCRTRAEAQRTGMRWFPYVKGSGFRKWYGNQSYVVNWQNDGAEIRALDGARPQNSNYYFRSGFAYNNISKNFCARKIEAGFIFDQKNSMFFSEDEQKSLVGLALVNSTAIIPFLNILSPKDFNPGSLKMVPVPSMVNDNKQICDIVSELVQIAKDDWDSFETSWDFSDHPLLRSRNKSTSIEPSFLNWSKMCENNIERMSQLEELINRHFVDAYGLSGEITCDVSADQIALARANREEDVGSLISYAIGCIMGRYSLSEAGLICACAANTGFDSSRYGGLSADEDGIVPITQAEWFSDDVANRFADFLKVAWSPESLKENLKFVAESLGPKASETPMDTLRRYLSRDYYKDHLKTYKNRPIYWLFSSGREKAFECLVYLHRYNEGTLSRMRMEYVTPLQGRVSARIEQLDRDIQAASTTAAQNKLRKEQEKLKKQQAELIKFDDELRHCADKRIKLDLDDGVRVNYAKFGNLLAEVKAVTGGSDE